jgi:hypothetical protein
VQDGVKYTDAKGTVLPDDAAAIAEGAKVARELKIDSGSETEGWSVEIKEGNRLVADIPFSSVD